MHNWVCLMSLLSHQSVCRTLREVEILNVSPSGALSQLAACAVRSQLSEDSKKHTTRGVAKFYLIFFFFAYKQIVTTQKLASHKSATTTTTRSDNNKLQKNLKETKNEQKKILLGQLKKVSFVYLMATLAMPIVFLTIINVIKMYLHS